MVLIFDVMIPLSCSKKTPSRYFAEKLVLNTLLYAKLNAINL